MALPLLTPRRLVVAGLLILVVLAFLPARFCGYGPPLSSAVLATLKPISVPAKYVGDSVRRRLEVPRVSDRVDMLNSLLEQREQEVLRLKMQVAELRRELEAVTEIRRLFPSYEHVIASVIARSADPASSLLQIDRGTAHRLEPGMPAVSGPHMVGRLRQVGSRGSSVLPITSAGMHLTAVVTRVGGELNTEPLCQFDADGSERLVAVVARSYPARVGDVARLMDKSWPEVVAGMYLGRVVEAEPLADDLLRKRLVIKTMIAIPYLDRVTVLARRRRAAEPESGGKP